MRKFFLLLACLCGLGFGEDDPKCGELIFMIEKIDATKSEKKEILESLEMPTQDMYNADTKEYCPCVETITCGKKEYCIAHKCSDRIFPILK
jgi:hypothetical protein